MQEDQQAIHKLKNRDRLTGLYNMEAFRTKLVQLLEAEENPQENTYALTMVDVNNFLMSTKISAQRWETVY